MGEAREHRDDDLLRAAAEGGHRVSKRLIDDWITKGLLPAPQRRGRGRLRGREPRLWTDEQRRLFLTLLDERARRVPVAVLCNVPVFMWLAYGESHAPLVQVRRALDTWVGRTHRSSWRAANQIARQVVSELDHPNAISADRRALREEVAGAAYRGKVDRDRLLATARLVFDPDAEGRGRGPLGVPLPPEDYVQCVEAQLEAIRQLPSLDDETFTLARLAYRGGVRWYAEIQPELAEDTKRAEFAPALTEQEVLRNACRDLLLFLGWSLMASETLLGLARSEAEEGGPSNTTRGE